MLTATPGSRRILVILGGLAAVGPLSIDMYLPAFPDLQTTFAATAGAVQGTLVTFLLGLSLGQLVYGPLSDRLGRRRPLLFGIGLYTLASLAAMLAPSLGWLAAARLAQGLGGCAGMVISRAVVRDSFEEHEAAAAFSTIMLVMGVAPVLAPVVGGTVLHLLSWRGLFALLVLFGTASFIMVYRNLPETLPPERRSSGRLVEILGAFIDLLGDRRFVGHTLAGGLIMSCLFAYIAGSPFIFITLHGLSPSHYGMVFGTNAAGLILASQVNVRLLRHFSGKAVAGTATLAAVVAGLILLAVAVIDPPGILPLWLPLFVVVGSVGLIGANQMAAAMARAGNRAGAASALMGVLQFGMGALSGTAVGLLENGTALPMAAVIAVLSVAGLLMHRLVALRG